MTLDARLQDSGILNEALPRVFEAVMARELDRVALVGSGSGSEPEGIRNISHVNDVEMGANGVALTDYSDILECVQAIMGMPAIGVRPRTLTMQAIGGSQRRRSSRGDLQERSGSKD